MSIVKSVSLSLKPRGYPWDLPGMSPWQHGYTIRLLGGLGPENVQARCAWRDGDSLGLGGDYIVENNLEYSSKVVSGEMEIAWGWVVTIL